MRTIDKEPGEALAYYADRLCRFADIAKLSGISTLVIVTAYDPLTGENMSSQRLVGNFYELIGALECSDISALNSYGGEEEDD